MLSFTAATNDISKRADSVANLDCRPYVPYLIGPSVILNAYNVYSVAHSDKVRPNTLIANVVFELLKEPHVNLLNCLFAKSGV